MVRRTIQLLLLNFVYVVQPVLLVALHMHLACTLWMKSRVLKAMMGD